jgi:thioredoxin family protein
MISFQYFDGCPNATATLQNLRNVGAELGIPADQINVVQVDDPDEADRLGFAGSPSVLLDGVDIYTGEKPEVASFSCRVFTFGDEQTGVIPEWFLRDKLRGGAGR